jgi:phage-related protein (TIGR01555 family)
VRGKGKAIPETVAPVVVPAPAPTKKKVVVTDTHVARAGAVYKRGETVAANDWNPCDPYQPPRGVVPKGWIPKRKTSAVLAMDDANGGLSNLSVSQAALNGVYSQGWTFMGYAYLSELAQIPEYRALSEVIALEMTKKWITFQAIGDEEKSASEEKREKIKTIEDEVNKHHLQDKFRQLAEQDGFFGRSHLYIDTGDTEDRDELRMPIGNGQSKLSKAKVSPRHPVKAFRVVEPIWTYPKDYNSNDPLREDWYNPSTWFVMAKEVHATRLLRFVGREVPDLLKPAYAFGGLSLSQMAKPYVDNWLRTRQSVADIVHAFSVFVLSTDLSTSLAEDGDQLFRRLELFNRLRDNKGVMALDKDTEDFKNVSASLAGLDALQAQTQEHMAAVGRTPITKLLGIQPTGLNASDENQLRNFEETIHAAQEAFIRPHLTTAIDFIQLSKFGEVDPDITFKFVPLRSLTEKEVADVQKVKADTHQVYVDMGAIAPEEVRAAVANDPETPYTGLDVDNMPEPEGPEPGHIRETERVDEGEEPQEPDNEDKR